MMRATPKSTIFTTPFAVTITFDDFMSAMNNVMRMGLGKSRRNLNRKTNRLVRRQRDSVDLFRQILAIVIGHHDERPAIRCNSSIP